MSEKINKNTLIERKSDLVSSDMDGETVMMSIENNKYYGLNPVGSRIWELISQPISFESLITALTKEFKVNTGDCEKDVSDFLLKLKEKDLVNFSDPDDL